jgi:hypothetical protein
MEAEMNLTETTICDVGWREGQDGLCQCRFQVSDFLAEGQRALWLKATDWRPYDGLDVPLDFLDGLILGTFGDRDDMAKRIRQYIETNRNATSVAVQFLPVDIQMPEEVARPGKKEWVG